MSKKVADALAGVLADSYVLMAKCQNYHWNVVGPNFFSLHEMFQGQYEELFPAVDEIAERIVQLGAPVPGRLAEFLRLTSLSEAEAGSAPAMVADLAACHTKVSSRAAAAMKIAVAAGDDGTADLLVQRMQAHDKAAWMLHATLGGAAEQVLPAGPKMLKADGQAKALPTARKTVKTAKAAKAPKAVKTAKAKIAKSASGKKKGRVAVG